jgi:hypothetical protein
MTTEEITQFYREIGGVCKKYNMSALVGVWFSGRGHDELGKMMFWDLSDTRMKAIVEAIAAKYEAWAKESVKYTPKPLGKIHEVRGRGKDQENN